MVTHDGLRKDRRMTKHFVLHGVGELARTRWCELVLFVSLHLLQFFLFLFIVEAHAPDGTLNGCVGERVATLLIVVLLELFELNATLLIKFKKLLDGPRRLLLQLFHQLLVRSVRCR